MALRAVPARPILAALALALLVSSVPPAPAFAEGAAAPAAAAPQPPSLTVVSAARREIVSKVVVTGTLTPRETVMVGADVDGLRIESLAVDEGDTVTAGQVLARLATDLVDVDLARADTQIARAAAAITQATALVDEAQSAAVEATSSLQRTRSLNEKGIVGQDILDQRVSAAAAANARLASVRQGVALAEADKASAEAARREFALRRAKAEIKAPTDGLVLARTARLGSVVSTAGGGLFEIARDGLIELDAEVSESALNALETGQSAAVVLASGDAITGRIRLVSPKVDATTRLGRVRIALPASPLLRTGAFGRATVETKRATGIVLPRTAVVTDGLKASVQVVKDGVVETRPVELGISAGDEVEITAGVGEGESVVSLAGTFVRDGDRVTPVAAEPVKTVEAAR
ncbi:efflux RND transporter periplasmic adaptor subunit [Aureimonas sp. AU12]|uniref:efflux RND transporter periplasmic adaptor subunit n=1 Tax=Aureimonas sp. AU12 TaxID=1638161 RepID=UPI00070665D5|nr:efflux RND transporter periplasmic adaptor subunit [Aureimonas sp. AU12]BAT29708.1 putative efflux transporter, RND family [Aureimonas sp. AU12]